MRELKFRGYLKKDNKMFPICDLNFNGVDPGAVGISSCGRLDCGLCEDYYEHADVEVMQYTGLIDKNGREIYEGDILTCHHDSPGKVFYHDGGFKLSSDQCPLDLENANSYDSLYEDLIIDNNLAVIGNIHENPELLGDTK